MDKLESSLDDIIATRRAVGQPSGLSTQKTTMLRDVPHPQLLDPSLPINARLGFHTKSTKGAALSVAPFDATSPSVHLHSRTQGTENPLKAQMSFPVPAKNRGAKKRTTSQAEMEDEFLVDGSPGPTSRGSNHQHHGNHNNGYSGERTLCYDEGSQNLSPHNQDTRKSVFERLGYVTGNHSRSSEGGFVVSMQDLNSPAQTDDSQPQITLPSNSRTETTVRNPKVPSTKRPIAERLGTIPSVLRTAEGFVTSRHFVKKMSGGCLDSQPEVVQSAGNSPVNPANAHGAQRTKALHQSAVGKESQYDVEDNMQVEPSRWRTRSSASGTAPTTESSMQSYGQTPKTSNTRSSLHDEPVSAKNTPGRKIVVPPGGFLSHRSREALVNGSSLPATTQTSKMDVDDVATESIGELKARDSNSAVSVSSGSLMNHQETISPVSSDLEGKSYRGKPPGGRSKERESERSAVRVSPISRSLSPLSTVHSPPGGAQNVGRKLHHSKPYDRPKEKRGSPQEELGRRGTTRLDRGRNGKAPSSAHLNEERLGKRGDRTISGGSSGSADLDAARAQFNGRPRPPKIHANQSYEQRVYDHGSSIEPEVMAISPISPDKSVHSDSDQQPQRSLSPGEWEPPKAAAYGKQENTEAQSNTGDGTQKTGPAGTSEVAASWAGEDVITDVDAMVSSKMTPSASSNASLRKSTKLAPVSRSSAFHARESTYTERHGSARPHPHLAANGPSIGIRNVLDPSPPDSRGSYQAVWSIADRDADPTRFLPLRSRFESGSPRTSHNHGRSLEQTSTSQADLEWDTYDGFDDSSGASHRHRMNPYAEPSYGPSRIFRDIEEDYIEVAEFYDRMDDYLDARYIPRERYGPPPVLDKPHPLRSETAQSQETPTIERRRLPSKPVVQDETTASGQAPSSSSEPTRIDPVAKAVPETSNYYEKDGIKFPFRNPMESLATQSPNIPQQGSSSAQPAGNTRSVPVIVPPVPPPIAPVGPMGPRPSGSRVKGPTLSERFRALSASKAASIAPASTAIPSANHSPTMIDLSGIEDDDLELADQASVIVSFPNVADIADAGQEDEDGVTSDVVVEHVQREAHNIDATDTNGTSHSLQVPGGDDGASGLTEELPQSFQQADEAELPDALDPGQDSSQEAPLQADSESRSGDPNRDYWRAPPRRDRYDRLREMPPTHFKRGTSVVEQTRGPFPRSKLAFYHPDPYLRPYSRPATRVPPSFFEREQNHRLGTTAYPLREGNGGPARNHPFNRPMAPNERNLYGSRTAEYPEYRVPWPPRPTWKSSSMGNPVLPSW
ncbi:hypothetical protein HDU93_009448 [Gonapodya sp. JEL0774]|nr:hypothetical protein HDU93_009448 [Gonapodya sp. JEL0774]